MKQRKRNWKEVRELVLQVKDKLGKGVDPGIVSLVTSLNFLDIQTSASCEGHLHWGTGGPYVDIESPEAWALNEEVETLRKNKSSDKKIDKIINKIKKLNEQELSKLVPFLDKFYKNRSVPYNQRLIVNNWSWSVGRIENQGIAWINSIPKLERGKLLKLFQKEINDFSKYLKKECEKVLMSEAKVKP